MVATPAGLPRGLTVADVLTLAQAARWLGVTEAYLRERQWSVPGILRESRQVVRFHPRTYLAKRLKQP